MKRHQIILIAFGILMTAASLGAGWFFFTSLSAKRAAANGRNEAYAELQRIYRSKVFPSDENVARVKEDQKALETWLATASNLVHKGDLLIEPKSPTGFKQVLQSTVRELSAHPGFNQGKVVAAGFNFGFDKYLGQSDSLPTPEHVDRLMRQLVIIERICKALYEANIMELKAVTREAFDEAGDDPAREETPSTSRKRRRRDEAPAAAAQAAPVIETSGYFSKQRFSFEFQARPAAFIEALNRLAALDLFVVVAETEFSKTADPLAAHRAALLENAGKAGAGKLDDAKVKVDPATLTHVQRIVTDPELEPPVNVKLDVDVYSFEGV